MGKPSDAAGALRSANPSAGEKTEAERSDKLGSAGAPAGDADAIVAAQSDNEASARSPKGKPEGTPSSAAEQWRGRTAW
jgi:hypothetical protein